jgi:hypothetical protein
MEVFSPYYIDEFLLNLCPALVYLGEPTGGEHHVPDPLCGAISKGFGGRLSGKDNDCQVDSPRQAAD